MNTTEFEIVEEGTLYRLPNYHIVEPGKVERNGEWTDISLVRGASQPDDDAGKRTGVLLETLLELLVVDLEYKASLVPCNESERILFHLRCAQDAMTARLTRRQNRKTLGTYRT